MAHTQKFMANAQRYDDYQAISNMKVLPLLSNKCRDFYMNDKHKLHSFNTKNDLSIESDDKFDQTKFETENFDHNLLSALWQDVDDWHLDNAPLNMTKEASFLEDRNADSLHYERQVNSAYISTRKINNTGQNMSSSRDWEPRTPPVPERLLSLIDELADEDAFFKLVKSYEAKVRHGELDSFTLHSQNRMAGGANGVFNSQEKREVLSTDDEETLAYSQHLNKHRPHLRHKGAASVSSRRAVTRGVNKSSCSPVPPNISLSPLPTLHDYSLDEDHSESRYRSDEWFERVKEAESAKRGTLNSFALDRLGVRKIDI